MMRMIDDRWQYALAVLAPAALAAWLMQFGALDGAQSFFLLHLAVYMVHQIEEHLYPGGFRRFANARVFETNDQNFPVSKAGVALVNIGFVWLPLSIAALAPNAAYVLGAAWFGLSFVNGITHLAASLRFRCYNPGVITAALGLIPLSVLFFEAQLASGALDGKDVVLALLAGVVLHIPVAAIFVVPFRNAKARPIASATS